MSDAYGSSVGRLERGVVLAEGNKVCRQGTVWGQ